MPSTLEELAQICGAKIEGELTCEISAVNTLKSAQKGDISFLANRRYASSLINTNASAVILKQEDYNDCPTNALITNDPYLAYAKIANHLYPKSNYKVSINEKINIGRNCSIDKTACISSNVFIGENVVIGADSYIGPGCVIQDNATIGNNSTLMSNVTLCHGVVLGNEIVLSPGVVIGADGFGLAQENNKWLKIPQIGTVIIQDKVEIGANSTVDRGAIEDTIIQMGVKIDNQVQIGHNAIIGENTAIAGCVAIAGSTIIGKRCQIGGASSISGHIEIADDVIITGMSGVPNSISSAGVYSSGLPVTDNKVWRRNIIRFKHLDEVIKKIIKRLDKE